MRNLYTQKITKPIGDILPARLDAKQTADILGFNEHDIAPLVKEELLEPLGKPMPNARKYFARIYIMQLAENDVWLSKATNTMYEYWQEKNAGRGRGEFSGAVNASLN